jgi:hypothetical protein
LNVSALTPIAYANNEDKAPETAFHIRITEQKFTERLVNSTLFRRCSRAKNKSINGSGLVGWEPPILPPESLQCQRISTFVDSSEDASHSSFPDMTNVLKTSLFHPTSPQLLLSHSTKEVCLGRYLFYAGKPTWVRKKISVIENCSKEMVFRTYSPQAAETQSDKTIH